MQLIQQQFVVTNRYTGLEDRVKACALDEYGVTDGVQYVDTPEAHTFRWTLPP